MICEVCGAENKDGANFCATCSSIFSQPAPAPAQHTQTPVFKEVFEQAKIHTDNYAPTRDGDPTLCMPPDALYTVGCNDSQASALAPADGYYNLLDASSRPIAAAQLADQTTPTPKRKKALWIAAIAVIAAIAILGGIQLRCVFIYNRGIDYLNEGMHYEAYETFMRIPNYADAWEHGVYAYGLYCMDMGEYEDAYYVFKDIGDFLNASEYMQMAQQLLYESAEMP